MYLHQPRSGALPGKSRIGNATQAGDGEFALARPLRVYLVEDSPQVRDLLLDFLNVENEVEIVGTADNEIESVEAILADPVDVVIVDLKLRDGSGMGVIAKLRRARNKQQPKIIVFSNHNFDAIRQRAMELGADHFFDKSTEYEALRAEIVAGR
ncbi:MAG: response regulator transcription factor, partial [Betaproteobacteria bacterium]